MESFGAYLKGLREEKGKSLEEISESTKVAVSNLVLLESDRYDLLPPRVFVKGFIRAYVQDLGKPPEEVLKLFEEFTREGELPDYSGEDHPVFHEKPAGMAFFYSPWFTVVLTAAGLLSLVVLLLTGGSRIASHVRSTKGNQPTVTSMHPANTLSETTSVPDETVQPSRQSLPSETSANRSGKKTLEIKALANAWVRVEPDNGPAEELMMAPGEVQIFTARSSFSLQTGNAGGLRIRFDGKELQALGRINQTLSLTLP